MLLLRVLPILFFAQVGFSAPTIVVTNTNAVYHLFKPVPRSELAPMESDLLVATQSPRTIDAGHSVLSFDIDWPFRDDAGANFPSFKLLFRVGVVKRFEIGLAYSFSPVVGFADNHIVALKSKWDLNPNSEGIFQLALTPSFGFGTSTGFNLGVGLPAEIAIHKKLRFGLSPQVVTGAGAFSKPSTNISTAGTITTVYNFEFSHSALLRYLPEPFVNFFIEYVGKLQALPNIIFSQPFVYSPRLDFGIEFTFWKNFQCALIPEIWIFETYFKVERKAGLAVRF